MRIRGICLITQDVPRLRDFYRDVLQTYSDGYENFTAFIFEGTQLSLCNEQIMEQMSPNSMVGAGCGSYTLEIEVDDVDMEYQRLTNLHIPIVKPPTTQPWGLRSVWFRDPDGNLVNFYTKVDDGKSTDLHFLIREFFQRLLNEKDLSVCGEFLSSDYRDHDAPPESLPGPKGSQEFVASFLEEYPDMHVEIKDVIVEGSKAAARIVWHGTHRETGEIFHQMGIVILRINDNMQFVERWSAYSTLE